MRGFLLGFVALGLIISTHGLAAAQVPPAPPQSCEDARATLDVHLRKVLTDRVRDEVEASGAIVRLQREIERLRGENEGLKKAAAPPTK